MTTSTHMHYLSTALSTADPFLSHLTMCLCPTITLQPPLLLSTADPILYR
jgi:hypothetical protein